MSAGVSDTTMKGVDGADAGAATRNTSSRLVSLPRPLLQLILANNKKRTAALRLTCKELLAAVDDGVTCLDFSIDSVPSHALSMLRRLPQLKTLQNLYPQHGRVHHMCRDLDPLSALVGLQHLELIGCEELLDLSPLSTLISLQHLELELCTGVEVLTPLSTLVSLQHLSLYSCTGVVVLTPLSTLVSLQHLSLDSCTGVEVLTPLSTLVSLRRLSLSLLEVDSLEPLFAMTKLRELDLSGCQDLWDLTPLSALTNLLDLDLSSCSGAAMVDLYPLSTLVRLQHLDFFDCEDLQDLTPLSALTKLLPGGGLNLGNEYLNLPGASLLGPFLPQESPYHQVRSEEVSSEDW